MRRKAVCVASTGGHLEELYLLHSTVLDPDEDPVWVTFDSPQSRSVLSDETDVVYMPRVGSRGYLELFRSFVPAWRVLRRVRPTVVYSTGAGIALAFLPLASLVGARAVYIESAARTAGPSLTGKLLSLLPWVRLRTQYRSWAGRRWHYAGSVFDGYEPIPLTTAQPPIRRLVVTLGTQEGYPFVSLVQGVQRIVPSDVEVQWQVGADFPDDLRPAGAHDVISRAQLREWIDSADAVVTHAGVGSALTLLEEGRTPVLVARSALRGEHIDEHQQLIAEELASRGLVIAVTPQDLSWDDVVRSTATRIRPVPARETAEQVLGD